MQLKVIAHWNASACCKDIWERGTDYTGHKCFSGKYGFGEQRNEGVQTWAPKGKMKIMIAMGKNTNNPNQNSEARARMHTLKESWPGHYCCATKHDCTGLQFDPAFQCSCVWLGSSIAKFECRDTVAYRAHTGHTSPLHTASYCFTGQVARLPSHTPESDCQIACRQKIVNSEKLMWTWTYLISPRHITTQHICQ